VNDDWLDELLLKPGETKVGRRQRVRSQGGFVVVPVIWKERLRGAGGAAYGLALELLRERWRANKETFPVSNTLAARAGFHAKPSATR